MHDSATSRVIVAIVVADLRNYARLRGYLCAAAVGTLAARATAIKS